MVHIILGNRGWETGAPFGCDRRQVQCDMELPTSEKWFP